jgi:hypothetical protein
MHFKDSVYGFTVESSQDWVMQSHDNNFVLEGGRYAIERPSLANLNISCRPITTETPLNKHIRVHSLKEYLIQNKPSSSTISPVQDAVTPISGEDNVVRVEIKIATGFFGRISMIHQDIELIIAFEGDEIIRSEIETIISSFRLPGSSLPIEGDGVTRSQAEINRLDDKNPNIRAQAKQNLIKIGRDAVTSLIASVNTCNLSIMVTSARNTGNAGISIEALTRRIEVLGDLQDSRSIPVFLNAIGDAVGAFDKAEQNYGILETAREVKQLLEVSLTALSKMGAKAVPHIIKVIDDPRPNIRIALVEVLGHIGGYEATLQLERIYNHDPERKVRLKAEETLQLGHKFGIFRSIMKFLLGG